MHLRRLWLTDFRNHGHDDLTLPPGLTAVVGPNGAGKTTLLEAVGFLSTLSSFRGAPGEVLVRSGAPVAVVRGEVVRGGRELLVECEIGSGRTVAQLNRRRGSSSGPPGGAAGQRLHPGRPGAGEGRSRGAPPFPR